ncbi:MAG TPA: NAD+ synthase [Firmicutes bacterium]|nr:NAD+ synthase [Bacillota bacterium]
MRITVAQLNPVVGDLSGNLDRIEHLLAGEAADSDLLVLPELYLTGYPPFGLLEKEWFRQQAVAALERLRSISARYRQTAILVGAPTPTEAGTGMDWYNSALLYAGGELLWTQHKATLPAYDLFNEAAYFQPGQPAPVVTINGKRLGVFIGEDLWALSSATQEELKPSSLLTELAVQTGLIINLAAYPYYCGWEEKLYRFGAACAQRFRIPFLFVNQVGANEETIFCGQSLLFDGDGNTRYVAPAFQEAVAAVDLEPETSSGEASTPPPRPTARRMVYDALVLGIRDYARKTGFTKAVVGLSGGIDSALVCCLAAEALGPKNVLAVTMPSPYSSVGSVEDSRVLAQNLGIDFHVIPITTFLQSFLTGLRPYIGHHNDPGDTTEENLQARIRTNILLAFSNKYGYLVLTAGNKSELMVGYCTLGGADLSGGLAVLADVPKTMVYELAMEANREREVIPEAIIAKPPSAELRPNQLDQDTLPPYPILDRILALYLDENWTPAEIKAAGFAAATVDWVIKAVHRSEFKRRQTAPGLRVTTNPLGPKRRLPVAGKFQV